MEQHLSIWRPHSALAATSLIWSCSLLSGAAAPDLCAQQQGESSCKGAYGKVELIHGRKTILRGKTSILYRGKLIMEKKFLKRTDCKINSFAPIGFLHSSEHVADASKLGVFQPNQSCSSCNSSAVQPLACTAALSATTGSTG